MRKKIFIISIFLLIILCAWFFIFSSNFGLKTRSGVNQNQENKKNDSVDESIKYLYGEVVKVENNIVYLNHIIDENHLNPVIYSVECDGNTDFESLVPKIENAADSKEIQYDKTKISIDYLNIGDYIVVGYEEGENYVVKSKSVVEQNVTKKTFADFTTEISE